MWARHSHLLEAFYQYIVQFDKVWTDINQKKTNQKN